MLYFRKEFKEVTKKHCHFYCFENESKNRKTVSTNLIAKRPLLMIIIENSKHDVALQ